VQLFAREDPAEAASIHSIPLKKQYVPAGAPSEPAENNWPCGASGDGESLLEIEVQKDGKTVAYKTAYFGEVGSSLKMFQHGTGG